MKKHNKEIFLYDAVYVDANDAYAVPIYKWFGIAEQLYIGHWNGNGMNLCYMWLCFEYEKIFIQRLGYRNSNKEYDTIII